ncbi:response regulator transcription factor [Paenibacillus turpanensis]|uniref:response regulator transcription factor n=1 Tax=Paenibacillus turpanensis TaxID=2689078 RepID=UPI00140868A8|nr:response regulator transcription factor [Paenibacillus turpanensis]
MEQQIRVWIVEDDKDWLRGLTSYLNRQDDIKVIESFGTPDEVRSRLELVTGGEADVVLMDIMLEDRPEGIVLAEEVSLQTGARVIMLTSMEEKELIFRSFQAGAIDYQLKTGFEQIPEAVRTAFRKESPISPAAADRLREEFRRLKKLEHEFHVKEVRDKVTPSELQLFELIGSGYTQSQIADKLVISIRTVKNHVGNALKKLGLSSSKEAVEKLKGLGILDVEKKKEQK